jgi:predicted XRE-type DNA-binding protein
MKITKGNVFDDLGFDVERSLELKIKADIMLAIRQHAERKKYTQTQLAAVLKEHQPTVSRLLNGRIDSITIDKLLRYAGRLNLGATLRITEPKPGKSKGKTVKSHKVGAHVSA